MSGFGVCRLLSIGIAVFSMVAPTLAEERRHRALRHETMGVRGGLVASPSPPRTVTPPGSYALSIDDALDLGGFVFKGGAPFLHTDGGDAFANTALGVDALISATPGVPAYYNGANNTALGDAALRDNTTGFNNAAAGAFSLQYNTTGSNNTAVGAYALIFNTTGSDNTALGANALVFDSSGYSNTAVGSSALMFNSTGFRNTAIGTLALYDNTGGSRNTAIGHTSLVSNTTGSLNAGLGAYALFSNTDGSFNTAAGLGALFNSSTGDFNTALGYMAGESNISGSNNIFIASYGADESNTLRVGEGTGTGLFEQNRAFISGIRGITTGQANAISVLIDSNGQLGTASSSRRFKEDIRDMGDASAGLGKLRPVTFRYRKAFENGDKPIRYGLIAEEVAEIFPEIVAYDAEGRPEAILDHLLMPMLLNELQKQSKTIARLEASHEALLQRLERLDVGPVGATARAHQRRPPPAP